MINDNLIERYFAEIKNYLLDKENQIKFSLVRNQCSEIQAGVYCFFIDNKIRYIGETGCIKKRINDLLNTKNHSFRRSFGELYFSENPLYKKASSSISYHPEIEALLSSKMNKHLSYSFFPMKIGRKEFEEWLQEHFAQNEFLNKRKKRK